MTTPAVNERFRVGGPGVVHETIDDETIIVNLDTGTYYDLNPSGARIFRGLILGAPVDQVISAVAEQFATASEAIAPDVERLVAELLAEGLIAAADDAGDGSGPSAPIAAIEPTSSPYAAPVLGRYTDMQQLLLLDPIHEVDETGWPRRA